jgi:hypothetical protein
MAQVTRAAGRVIDFSARLGRAPTTIFAGAVEKLGCWSGYRPCDTCRRPVARVPSPTTGLDQQ